MIENTLQKMGFNEKEIVLYLELLRRGKATPAALSKATGISRSTLYGVAKELVEKGIMAEDLGGKMRYLVALPPDNLQALIQHEENKTKRIRQLVHRAMDELAELPLNTHYAVPRIRFVEDESVQDHLYKYFKTWQENAEKTDGTWWGFQDHTFVQSFKEWISWTFKEGAQKDLNYLVKLLSNESDVEHQMGQENSEQRQIKFWKKNADFTSSTWIIGDYIIMIYTRERPFYLIEINNAVLAHNLRETFKGIWTDLKKFD